MTWHAPDWLAQRDGRLQQAPDRQTWFVLIGNDAKYRLTPLPAAGRHACAVADTVNGRRLDQGTATYDTEDAALRGGLEELRAALGW
jgi:hypothetical protein